jgi:hypothetical protein
MKQIATRLVILTAATLISALPVLAGEVNSGMGTMNQGDQNQKDECLLVSQNCRDNVDTIQQRMERLSREIGKGTNVYTPKELRQMEFQLRENQDLLRDLMRGGT